MPEIPDDVRNEGGHIYFDADYEQWQNEKFKKTHGSSGSKY
jgi:hypothetical protein